MRILVDAGNTATKWQLRDGGSVLEDGQGAIPDLNRWIAALDPSHHYSVAVSCVRDDAYALKLKEALDCVSDGETQFAASNDVFAGVRNAYIEPQSLGVDRWLAILAIKARGEHSAVIIDIGTACTIDVLDRGQHLGGYIFPGMRLARNALITNTDKIRFSDDPVPSIAPGASTADCVLSGIWLTLLAACQNVIDRFPEASVYLTGGSAAELAELGLEGQRVDGLVFDGLDFWLNGA